MFLLSYLISPKSLGTAIIRIIGFASIVAGAFSIVYYFTAKDDSQLVSAKVDEGDGEW